MASPVTAVAFSISAILLCVFSVPGYPGCRLSGESKGNGSEFLESNWGDLPALASTLNSIRANGKIGRRIMTKTAVTKEQAIEKAIQAGKEAYGNIDSFAVSVDEDPEYWLIHFAKDLPLVDGDGQHFTVWINKITGAARLFKGR